MMAVTGGLLSAAMVGLATITTAAPASALTFSESSIEGTYTLNVAGFTAPGNLLGLTEGTPLFAVATVTFNGFGGCSSADKVVAGGSTLPDPGLSAATSALTLRVASACTYEVQPDGFGTFSVTFDEPLESTTTTTFVITNRDEIQLIANNGELGIYGGGVLKRQQR